MAHRKSFCLQTVRCIYFCWPSLRNAYWVYHF